MIVVKFKSSSEAKDLLKKVKKMTKYSEELEDVLTECIEDDDDDDYREDDEEMTTSHRGRRRYRKM